MYSFIKYIFCKHSLHWNTKNKTHTIFSNRIICNYINTYLWFCANKTAHIDMIRNCLCSSRIIGRGSPTCTDTSAYTSISKCPRNAAGIGRSAYCATGRTGNASAACAAPDRTSWSCCGYCGRTSYSEPCNTPSGSGFIDTGSNQSISIAKRTSTF